MDEDRELLRGNTPTLVLAILMEGAQHGYAIAREINRRSDNALQLKQGTLYPALHALERDGMIVGEWEVGGGERPRRIYTITPAGKAELERRARTWRRFSSAMQNVIGGGLGEQPA